MKRPEVMSCVFSAYSSTLFSLETGSLSDPGAHHFTYVIWPVSFMGLLVPTFNISEQQDFMAVADF